MRNRAGQRIGGIGTWIAGKCEQAGDHGLHLLLGGLAVADHGLLDLHRGVFSHVEVGASVRLGQPIGTVESLQGHYPGITDHVHLEILDRGERMNAASLIVPTMVARLEATDTAAD